MTRSKAASLAIAIAALVLVAWPAAAQARVIERVSVDSAEVQADGWNDYATISGDGRYVAFQSAVALVADDTNGVEDIYVRDRQAGTTVRVSLATDGTEGNGPSTYPSISADGAWVAFTSAADNLVTGDTNLVEDVFLHEIATGVTTRVSVATDGTQANDQSGYPYVCADGSVVAFSSFASNLVDGDTNLGPNSDGEDIFVWVRSGAVTERASVSTAGAEGDSDSLWPSLSADGRYVCFSSWATNLVEGDTNETADIFVRDRTGATTERVSVAADGSESEDWSDYPSISADGRYVAYDSLAGNLVAGDNNFDWDVIVRDRTGGTTTRVSVSTAGTEGDQPSAWPSISADGRYVAFESFATNLVPGAAGTEYHGDVYIRDRTGGTTTRLSTSSTGTQGNAWSGTAVISADGRCVVFESFATNLVTPDANADDSDVFVVINPATTTYDSYRGSDRYDTAIKLAKALYPSALPADSGLVIAPGETFQEALCGAPLAAAYGGPVLLTYKTTVLPNNVRAELLRLAPKYVFCIGLSTTSVNSVIAAVGASVTVVPITGVDVYTMSRNVAGALETKVGDMTGAVGIVTRGDLFPDAIGVSPLACAKLWPIILTHSPGATLHAQAAATMSDLGLTQTIKVGTYATMPGGVTGLANLSGTDRYITNANVANWAKNNAGLAFTHTGLATGDKFPDALAAGPFLAAQDGILLLSPLNGPLPPAPSAVLRANAASVYRFSLIAMIEPVISQARALLP